MSTHVSGRIAPRRVAQVAGLLGLLVLGAGLAAMATPTAPEPAANRYVGAEKCKNCHKSASSGDQWGKWQSMKHAKAFETLAGDQAKELGKAKGIDDPQKAEACAKCHVTAFGVAADEIAKGFKPELGVQCETCHGPGEAHMKARLAAASAGDEAAAATVPEGEIIAVPRADTCVKCHNPESPSYKPFCFMKMNAQIAHPNPAKKRSDDELKAMMNPYGCTETECKCPKQAGDASKPADAGEKPKDG